MENITSSASEKRPLWWQDPDGTLHEWYHAAIFLADGTHLGDFEIDPGAHPELHWRRSGLAYYCPHCGEVWARIVFWESGGRQALLDAFTVSCEQHPDPWEVAGSLLHSTIEDIIDLLPEPAVRRELGIYLRKMERRR